MFNVDLNENTAITRTVHEGQTVPNVTFRTRVRDESVEGPNPFRWENKTTDDYFKGKRVVLFGLPGAFTPTCSTYQVPQYETHFEQLNSMGIDEIYCVSVNDSFVMNAWVASSGVKKIKVIPDGNGEFTAGLGMLVKKTNLGFGMRSWRYAAIVNDGVIEKWFEEPGIQHNSEVDPYGESSALSIVTYLQSL